MSLEPLLHVPLTIDQDCYHDKVIELLQIIKPEWKKESIKIAKLKKGFVNLLLRCSDGATDKQMEEKEEENSQENDEEKEELVVRVFSRFGLTQFFDRESEIQTMRVFSQEGLIDKIYCRFENGVVYRFCCGETLTRKNLENAKIQELIAKELHKLHAVDVEKYVGDLKRINIMDRMKERFRIIQSDEYSDVIQSERYKANFPPLEKLGDAILELDEISRELFETFPVTWNHADCHLDNIVYDEKRGRVRFLDWESSFKFPEVHDAAILFDRNVTRAVEFDTPAHRREWMETYLSTHPVHGQHKRVPEELLDLWYIGSVKSSIISTFNIAILCLQATKQNHMTTFDFLQYAIYFYDRYQTYTREWKELVQN